MGASGNPAKRAAAKKKALVITPESEWLEEAEGTLTELPSGRVVRIIMPGMQEFISAGLIPNTLLPVVMGAIESTKPMTPSEAAALKNDPQILIEMAETMDRIFVHCVTEPVFHLAPENGGERVKGVLYADRVRMDDKQFVFQAAVGGTRDLEDFRSRSQQVMADIQSVDETQSSTE